MAKKLSNADEVVPENWRRKRRFKLNESTYYNTKGYGWRVSVSTYFSQLRE